MRERSAIPKEFGLEFEAQQQTLMRTRLLWYLIVANVLNVFGILLSLFGVLAAETGLFNLLMQMDGQQVGQAQYDINRVTMWSSFLLSLPGVALYLWALKRVSGRPITREAGLRLVYWLIVAPAVIALLGSVLSAEIGGHLLGARESAEVFSRSIGLGGAITVFFSHFLACLFLPWRPRESVRPMLPLIALNALIALYTLWGDWVNYGAVVVISVVVMLPGTALCWLKHARFTKRFAEKQFRTAYGELRFELSAARQIHDAMFPEPVTDGPVRVTYRYEPMRQIGGDYVFVRSDKNAITVVLIDVTGHGVGAALTVNRLHGEVSRLLAEEPDIGPGDLLGGLNRYLHITLAKHSVYATAMCIRAELASETIRYANAGHPPAFLMRSGGKLEHLDSTTFLLGVCEGVDFQPNEQAIGFVPGDRLIAYTDGATEALNEDGRQLRVGGLESVVRGLDGSEDDWTQHIVDAVDAHRHGPAQDDTLVIQLLRMPESG